MSLRSDLERFAKAWDDVIIMFCKTFYIDRFVKWLNKLK